MHSKTDIMEIMTYDKADEVIEERFESLFFRYQIGLETLMKFSHFIFVSLMIVVIYYIVNVINFNHSGSYTDSPDWIKNKQKNPNKFC